jgi:hypothetical protein
LPGDFVEDGTHSAQDGAVIRGVKIRLWRQNRRRPRVGARASRQPWALLWNAVGVQCPPPSAPRTGIGTMEVGRDDARRVVWNPTPASAPAPALRTPRAFAQRRAGLASLRAYPISSGQRTTTPTGLHPPPALRARTPRPAPPCTPCRRPRRRRLLNE